MTLNPFEVGPSRLDGKLDVNILENQKDQLSNDYLYTVRELRKDEPILHSIKKSINGTVGKFPLEFEKAYTFNDTPTTTENSNKQLLWHGTKFRNLPSIMKTGLKSETGYDEAAIGIGLYFTRDVMLAATVANADVALLLLCEVDLGDTMQVSSLIRANKTTVDGSGYDSVSHVEDQFDINQFHSVEDKYGARFYDESRSKDFRGHHFKVEWSSRLKYGPMGYNQFCVNDNSRVKVRYIVTAKQHYEIRGINDHYLNKIVLSEICSAKSVWYLSTKQLKNVMVAVIRYIKTFGENEDLLKDFDLKMKSTWYIPTITIFTNEFKQDLTNRVDHWNDLD